MGGFYSSLQQTGFFTCSVRCVSYTWSKHKQLVKVRECAFWKEKPKEKQLYLNIMTDLNAQMSKYKIREGVL